MEKSERKRSLNCTRREKENIISLVQKYIAVDENKKTNAVFNKQKIECWEKLTWEFNALQTTGPRTGLQLKSAYEQMKKLAKQHKSEDKVEMMKTGGGIFEIKSTVMDEKILCLLKDNYFSINNKFDSNVTSETISDVQNYPSRLSASADNSENIILLCENNLDESHDIKSDKCTDVPPRKKIKVADVEHIQVTPRKKSKASNNTSSHTNTSIVDKKREILDLKINILKKIEETECENLKGKSLDNEIKKIAKEKEIFELKIKKYEYKNLKRCCNN